MNVIISPIISEKSMIDAVNGRYAFRVARFASKIDIKIAIEKRFSVSVTNISTSVLKGRSVKVGAKRTEKKLTATKKAIVTVKKGDKIGLFELGDK